MQDIGLLREALPYLRKFKGALFVLKFGGEAIRTRELQEKLAEDISFLYSVGINLVIVHGGGAQVTEMEKKLGVESRKIAGRRVTSPESIDVLKMMLSGKLNVEIVASLQSAGVRAVGLSALSAGIIQSRKKAPGKVTGGGDQDIDFGMVGEIVACNVDALRALLNAGFLPVVSPLSTDATGQVLNINADTIAARIAAELKAEKLMLMIDKPGIMSDLNDPTTLISQISAAQARQAISEGIISDGMIPKVEEAVRALQNGVSQVHVLSGVEPHQLLVEVFTESGCGTMLLP